MTTDTKQKCGFVALIGAPNAGKSTLLNTAVGSKVSIVTHKAQTTRSRILGICIRGDAQMIFVDMPGIFTDAKRRLEKAMVSAAWQSVFDADIRLVLVDAARGRAIEETQPIIDELKKAGGKALLALNKTDVVQKEKLLTLAKHFSETGIFEQIFMISAKEGDGVQDLLKTLEEKLPASPWLYPEDQISDMPLRLMAAEVTREQVFLQLHEEIPYSIAVETESWEERKDGSVAIGQVIYVLKDSQKAIVLGKGGSRIKEIGTAARTQLEEIFNRRVHLNIFVKVREKWMNDPERYTEWGLDFNAR